MIKFWTLILNAIILLGSCNFDKTTSHKNSLDKNSNTKLLPSFSEPNSGFGANKILLNSTVKRYFSNKKFKDTFTISIQGSTILSGSVIFKIENSKGNLLLLEKYPSKYLIGYALDDKASVKQQEEYIKKRVKEFLLPEKFTSPAIPNSMIFDNDYSDKLIWDEIKMNQSSIGFNYLIGEEKNCSIAFSSKFNTVVEYFCCC